MHITFEKDWLFPQLQYLTRIANNRKTLPILNHVLFAAEHGDTTLSATNLERR